MKKRYFIIIFVLFMIPSVVFGKEYDITNIEENNPFIINGEYQVIKPGDVIKATSDKYRIRVGGGYVNYCLGSDTGCQTTYTVTDTMLIYQVQLISQSYAQNTIIFKCIPENARLFYYDKTLKENNIYITDDVVIYPTGGFSNYFYDQSGQELVLEQDLIVVLPKHNEKKTVWRLSFVEEGQYAPVSSIFTEYPYQEPVFELSCKDNTIKYGEKTRCSISVTSVIPVNTISFDLSTPKFKISNIKEGNGVTKIDGNKEYNYRMNMDNTFSVTKFTLMTFDVEGTKNEIYTDDIFMRNIDYTDEAFSGNYEELRSDLQVIPYSVNNNVNNPETGIDYLLIIIPIMLLAVSLGVVQFRGEIKKKI